MSTEKLLEHLVDDYFTSRPNLQVHNDPLCIFFLACSGAGKSTTRKRIVEKLHATYVCNDEVRDLLLQYPNAAEQNIELKTIVSRVVEKIFAESPNKLVVFDNNIIQYYMYEDSYLNVAKAKGRPIFIIELEATENELTKRIIDRGVNVTHILSEVAGQIKDFQKAKNDIKANYIMNQDGDIEALITRIQNFNVLK